MKYVVRQLGALQQKRTNNPSLEFTDYLSCCEVPVEPRVDPDEPAAFARLARLFIRPTVTVAMTALRNFLRLE